MRALSRKKAMAVSALLSNRTVGEAAEAIQIGQSTLFRWLQDRDFQRALTDAKAKVVGQAITQLQRTCSEAVDTLKDVMNDSENPASARVSAARTVLDMAVKAVEVEDLTARIEALEKRLMD